MNMRHLLILAVALVTLVGTTLLYAVNKDEKAALEMQLQELLKARVASAEAEVAVNKAAYDSAQLTFDALLPAAKRLADAQVAAAATQGEKVAALRQYADMAGDVERLFKTRLDQGVSGVSTAEYYVAKYESETARIELLKAELATGR